jgi:rhodanese-related sulfurtransferase
MNKRFLLEAAALIAAAVLCALVSNALAARERKLALVGYYPNAQKVPAQATETTAVTATVVTPASATTTSAPATTTIVVPTATAPPKTTTTASRPPAPAPVPAPGLSSPPAPKPDIVRFVAHPDKPYVEIAFADVKALHDAGVLFLDARRTSVYEQGHVAGARPFSVWESDIDDKVRKLFDERGEPSQQAQPIVVYCSGGDCEDSHMLAQKLWGIQFNNVYVYKDGFPDWQKRGGAIHTGSNP